MVATLCLITFALATGQPPQKGDWQLTPQLSRGQELLYSGTFTEEALSPGVQFQRSFRIDTALFVLETGPREFEIGMLTTVSPREVGKERDPAAAKTPPSSVRLEVLNLDKQGKLLTAHAAKLLPPLEGPPTIECGILQEMPKGKVGLNHTWEVNEAGRTPRTWRVSGAEAVSNVHCVKLMAVQQSDDWGTPRADRMAWQRRDTLWVSPQLGIVCKYERIFERRDAAREAPTHRSVLRCELDSGLTYPGKLFDDRRNEIQQAAKFAQEADGWLREVDKHKFQVEALAKRIKNYLDTEPSTPYRPAILQVRKRIEAGLRGESIPDPQNAMAALPVPKAMLGQRLPDFVCTDLLTRQTYRLERMLGQPLLVVFYNPATEPGQKALSYAHAVAQWQPQGITILAMADSDDIAFVRAQHKAMKLPFSILDGTGLHQTFGVDATPRVVVLDGQGIVRGAWTGWGGHTPKEVTEHLQKWLPK